MRRASGRTRVNIKLSEGEKICWFEGMVDLGVFQGWSKGIRKCLRLALLEGRGTPPPLKCVVPDVSIHSHMTTISIDVDDDLICALHAGRHREGFDSISDYVVSVMRGILSIAGPSAGPSASGS